MPVNIVEPEFWTHRDASARQWEFGAESLTDLREALADQGLPLDIRIDEAVEVRDRPCRRYRIGQIVSQEETGTHVPSRTARVDTSRRRSMPDL